MDDFLKDLYKIENLKATIKNQEVYTTQLQSELEFLEEEFGRKYKEQRVELRIEAGKVTTEAVKIERGE